MILNNQSGVVEVVGDNTSLTSSIDMTRINKLSYILTEGLYKDAASAVIVELSNNGVDSIIESGKDPIENPVLVKLNTISYNNYTLTIEDKGIGMDKDFFETKFMSLLYSTKETSNDYIGSFGLGGKSWASLGRTVTFTITKDGKRWKYLCYKGETLIDFDLLSEEDTTEENGVLFSMPIYSSEYYGYQAKAKQKLAYYDTVGLVINNLVWDNKIYRNDLFQYSSNSPYSDLHICLKDVVYRLDWDKLGIPSINIPIAIRFSLNEGIGVTPSREDILYSKATIDLVKRKIEEVADWFVDKFNENVMEPMRLYDAFPLIDVRSKLVSLTDKQFDAEPLGKYATKKFNEVPVIGMKYYSPSYWKGRMTSLMTTFVVKADYQTNGVWKTTRLYWSSPDRMFANKQKAILCDSPVGNIKEYLKETCGRGSVFVSLQEDSLYWMKKNILIGHPKSQWRERIKEYQAVRQTIIEDWCTDYREVEKSAAYIAWLAKRKAWLKANKGVIPGMYKTLDKKEGEVTISYPRKSKISSWEWVFEKETFKIEELGKSTKQVVIVFRDDQKELAQDMANLVVKERVAIIGVREYSKIKHIQQFKTYEEFMTDNKPFRRMATSLVARKKVEEFEQLHGRNNPIVTECLQKLDADIRAVKDYNYSNSEYTISSAAKVAILDVATELNLWDEEIMPTINRIEKAIETFGFLRLIIKPNSWDEGTKAEVNHFINQMLLFRKKHYKDLEGYELVYKAPEVVVLEEDEEVSVDDIS